MSPLVFSPYNEYWRHLRKITVMELFSVNRVWSFRSIREEEVWDLIEFIASSEGRSINLSDKIYTMTSFNIADLYPSLAFLCLILENIVGEHKMKRKASNNTSGDERDLVDTLLNYEEANKPEFHLTTNQIKVVAMGRPDIYFAGSESFATTIEWEMSELLRNLRVMEKAQSEFRVAPTRCRCRICLGISFATSNIELGLAQLLYRFNWKLPNDTKSEALDMAKNFGITDSRRNNLHVITTIHIPFRK
ncbi:hypothetical protein PRUPE_2G073900 [Prunus persica]|uniref:Cytochrome P450 n=1 Tax=Prunus persica TaxID=3760 RepID=A0A251QCQ4_PRUPE|nr:hypothetical protein PRUPE_2G073900 [Prunus persica]